MTVAVTVVVVVYLVVQSGPGDKWTLWFINEGREYIEAPRWADIGIVLCMAAIFYNVAGTFVAGKWSGISGVLVLDLIALAGLYLAGMFYTTNLPLDQYWWWVIHLWVEATWEVLVGCIMAWGLMKTLATPPCQRPANAPTPLALLIIESHGACIFGCPNVRTRPRPRACRGGRNRQYAGFSVRARWSRSCWLSTCSTFLGSVERERGCPTDYATSRAAADLPS